MAKMVNGQRNLGANHAPDPSNIFIQLFQALFRHMHVSKRMRNPIKIIQLRISRRAFSPCAGPCNLTHLFLHGPQFIHPVQRTAVISFLGHQKLHAEYFDHGKSLVHIPLQDAAHLLRFHQNAGGPSLLDVGIRVKSYLIPEPSAQKLVHRHAVRLACQIPEGQLYGAHTGRLPCRTAELFDFPEYPVHFTGVFPYNPALQIL